MSLSFIVSLSLFWVSFTSLKCVLLCNRSGKLSCKLSLLLAMGASASSAAETGDPVTKTDKTSIAHAAALAIAQSAPDVVISVHAVGGQVLFGPQQVVATTTADRC